jgi:hypothetical protein
MDSTGSEPNPFVGGSMHTRRDGKAGKMPEMSGRKLRRAEERGYGEVQPKRPRKRKKR